MGSCASCKEKILELGSNQCLGHACDKRLCFRCFSETAGLCPRCKILREIEGEHMKSGGGSQTTMDELYRKLGEVE